MVYTRDLCLLILFFSLTLVDCRVHAQNVFNNAIVPPGSSDNTAGANQPGSEVLHSSADMGVVFETGSTFEHVGQFYVAGDGIWNHSISQVGSTDYFGYAPRKFGSYIPYQGKGIKGASSNNGGQGAGRPTFGNLELNSTGDFPVMAGMYIINSLAFNENGPAGSNVITTPSISAPDSPTNAVVFSPIARITGVNEANYINGFASVTDVTASFTLPLGDATDTVNPLHTLTINNAVNGTVTARYLHSLQHSDAAYGAGISWVSPIGNWSVAAPAGTSVTVNMPALNLLPEEAVHLRMVGWNGHKWLDLSMASTPGSCITGNCPLTGTLTANITDLAIGLSKTPSKGSNLTVWPSPTQGPLHLTVSADKIINDVRIIDQQGRSLLNPSRAALDTGLDVSILPTGSYIVEVRTTEGQILRQRFIRQ